VKSVGEEGDGDPDDVRTVHEEQNAALDETRTADEEWNSETRSSHDPELDRLLLQIARAPALCR
jgi:hypothetical protein